MADGAYRSIFLFTSLATRYLLSCRRGRAPAPPSYRRHASLAGAPAPGPPHPLGRKQKALLAHARRHARGTKGLTPLRGTTPIGGPPAGSRWTRRGSNPPTPRSPWASPPL